MSKLPHTFLILRFLYFLIYIYYEDYSFYLGLKLGKLISLPFKDQFVRHFRSFLRFSDKVGAYLSFNLSFHSMIIFKNMHYLVVKGVFVDIFSNFYPLNLHLSLFFSYNLLEG